MKLLFFKKKKIQKIIKLIIFFIIETRLDIAFAILLVSYFAKNLCYLYTKVVKTILKYFKGSKNEKITYKERKKNLKII